MAAGVVKAQALLFDFFGTLVEYTADRTAVSFTQSHEVFSRQYPGVAYQAYCDAWDLSFSQLAAQDRSGREFLMRDVALLVIEQLGIQGSNVSSTRLDSLVEQYMADWSRDIVPITGAHGLLKRLSKHYQLGLVSNTHHAPTVYRLLNTFDLLPLFSVVTLSAESGYAKPHRSIFDETLKKMAVAPNDAVYIGDSFEADYCGGTDAGLACYLIGRHARVPRDRQLRNIQDLAIYFDTMRN